MADSNGESRPVVTLALELSTTADGRDVTPPAELATGATGWQNDLQALRERLAAEARAQLDSGSVSVDDLRFDDLGAGGLTAIAGLVTSARDPLLLDRFGPGIAQLPARWAGPLQAFLRNVMGQQALEVTVHRTYVETEPRASSAPPPKTLTRREQRVIRGVSAGAGAVIALFVILVLAGVPPFATWLVLGGRLP